MFRHILVTLDGSPYSERALSYAADLAKVMPARITLLTVAPDDVSPVGGNAAADDAIDRDGLQPWDRYLEEQEGHLREAGVADISTHLTSGVPDQAITEFALNEGVDVIVMSTQGLAASSDYGLGSVATKVLMSAPCPVLMVRISKPAPPRGPSEERWQTEGGRNVG